MFIVLNIILRESRGHFILKIQDILRKADLIDLTKNVYVRIQN